MRCLLLSCVVALSVACARDVPPVPNIVAEAREAVGKNDVAAGQRAVDAFRATHGVTPAAIEALSVLAQGAFAATDFDRAGALAEETYALAVKTLAGRGLDDEPQVPIALGRAIEIAARVQVERGARAEAMQFLERELASRRNTSIEKRIQKNINLLTLEGTVAPPLDLSIALGGEPPTVASLNGNVVVLFFWAHWCLDCRAQAPILARLLAKYEKQGLTIIAPTQRYGYVAGGVAADPVVEDPYIDSVRQTHYPMLAGRPIPLGDANHRRYGVSSTPTLVLVDRAGIIRLYHPGRMTEEELDPILRRLVDEGA